MIYEMNVVSQVSFTTAFPNPDGVDGTDWAEVRIVTEKSAILLIGPPSRENFESLLSEQNVGYLCGQALTNRRGSPRGSSMCGLLLQKVVTDCMGDLSRGLFVDPKVVELWKLLCFRSWEDRCKPLHAPLCLCGMVFPAIHEQDACGYFLIVFIAIVKASHFLMFAQSASFLS